MIGVEYLVDGPLERAYLDSVEVKRSQFVAKVGSVRMAGVLVNRPDLQPRPIRIDVG